MQPLSSIAIAPAAAAHAGALPQADSLLAGARHCGLAQDVVCLDLDQPQADSGRYWELLDSEERQRTGRYRLARDAARFALRRACLRLLLAERLGCDARAIPLRADPFGKLSVPGTELRFNLSHARGMALYAFAWGREIGCDIEWLDPDFACLRTAEGFFAPLEVEELRRLPRAQQTGGFFNCWTRKEAYVKGCGLGLSVPLDSFAVTLAPDAPALFQLGGEGWSLVSFAPRPNYQAALALAPSI